jgi:hypothetical protein
VLPAGSRVVVHDPIGDWTGVGIAEQVAAAGLPCALVTPDAVAGTQLSRTGDLADANGRLERAGVARELFARLRSVGGGTALLTDVDHGAAREIPCTVVIDCAHRLPDGDLWRARRGLLRDEQLPTRGAGSPDSRCRSSRLAVPELATRGAGSPDSRELTALTALTARRAGARGTTHGGSGRESRGPAARLVPAGDCVAPRTVHEAVREGRRAVQRLRRAAGIVGADRPDARPVP